MVLRQSRSGHFLGCTGYPECRGTRPCDEHGNPLNVVAAEELTQPCQECGAGTLRVKFKGRRAFLGCDQYPKCKATASIPEGTEVRRPPAPPPEQAGVKCEKCGQPMVLRIGRKGQFIACTGYPKCRNTHPVEKLAALQAAQPAAPIPLAREVSAEEAAAIREAVANAPPVKHAGKTAGGAPSGDPPPGFAWTRTGRPVVEVMPQGNLACPQCGSTMDLKRGRFGPFFSCTNFPRCKFNANLRGEAKKQAEELLPAPARPKPIMTDLPCPECGQPMVVRRGPRGRFLGCSAYPKCKGTQEFPPGFDVEKYAAAAGVSAE
jgi:DNA topoisomerase-1